jgi:hypothetical protein
MKQKFKRLTAGFLALIMTMSLASFAFADAAEDTAGSTEAAETTVSYYEGDEPTEVVGALPEYPLYDEAYEYDEPYDELYDEPEVFFAPQAYVGFAPSDLGLVITPSSPTPVVLEPHLRPAVRGQINNEHLGLVTLDIRTNMIESHVDQNMINNTAEDKISQIINDFLYEEFGYDLPDFIDVEYILQGAVAQFLTESFAEYVLGNVALSVVTNELLREHLADTIATLFWNDINLNYTLWRQFRSGDSGPPYFLRYHWYGPNVLVAVNNQFANNLSALLQGFSVDAVDFEQVVKDAVNEAIDISDVEDFVSFQILVPETYVSITVNFYGLYGVVLRYSTNVSGWQNAGTFDGYGTFKLPSEHLPTWGNMTLQVQYRGMLHNFSITQAELDTEELTLYVPLTQLVVEGIFPGSVLSTQRVGGSWVHQNIAVTSEDAVTFTVFDNGSTYLVNIERTGFHRVQRTAAMDEYGVYRVDFSDVTYTVLIPAGVSGLRIHSNNWIVNHGLQTNIVGGRLFLHNTGENATMYFTYEGIEYRVVFALDGTSPFAYTHVVVNFAGFNNVAVSMINGPGFVQLGSADDTMQFAAPRAVSLVRVARGTMLYDFPVNFTNTVAVTLNVPVVPITIHGINGTADVSVWQNGNAVLPAQTATGNVAFNVFDNPEPFSIRIVANGFWPLNFTGIMAGQSFFAGSPFYNIRVPEGVTDIRVVDYTRSFHRPAVTRSIWWVGPGSGVSGNHQNVVTLFNNGTAANLHFIFQGAEYVRPFTLNGTDPFPALFAPANLEALVTIIAEANELSFFDYTGASWTILQNALTAAGALLNNTIALHQYRVDAAVTAIQNAIDGLQEFTGESVSLGAVVWGNDSTGFRTINRTVVLTNLRDIDLNNLGVRLVDHSRSDSVLSLQTTQISVLADGQANINVRADVFARHYGEYSATLEVFMGDIVLDSVLIEYTVVAGAPWRSAPNTHTVEVRNMLRLQLWGIVEGHLTTIASGFLVDMLVDLMLGEMIDPILDEFLSSEMLVELAAPFVGQFLNDFLTDLLGANIANIIDIEDLVQRVMEGALEPIFVDGIINEIVDQIVNRLIAEIDLAELVVALMLDGVASQIWNNGNINVGNFIIGTIWDNNAGWSAGIMTPFAVGIGGIATRMTTQLIGPVLSGNMDAFANLIDLGSLDLAILPGTDVLINIVTGSIGHVIDNRDSAQWNDLFNNILSGALAGADDWALDLYVRIIEALYEAGYISTAINLIERLLERLSPIVGSEVEIQQFSDDSLSKFVIYLEQLRDIINKLPWSEWRDGAVGKVHSVIEWIREWKNSDKGVEYGYADYTILDNILDYVVSYVNRRMLTYGALTAFDAAVYALENVDRNLRENQQYQIDALVDAFNAVQLDTREYYEELYDLIQEALDRLEANANYTAESVYYVMYHVGQAEGYFGDYASSDSRGTFEGRIASLSYALEFLLEYDSVVITSPATIAADVIQGTAHAFSANFDAVVWSLVDIPEGVTGISITEGGVLLVAGAATLGTHAFGVRAELNYDNFEVAEITITVVASAAVPVVTSVSIFGGSVTRPQGQVAPHQLSATVNGSGSPIQTVIWSLHNSDGDLLASAGTAFNGVTVSSSGLVTFAVNAAVDTYQVRATSLIAPSQYSQASVTVTLPEVTGNNGGVNTESVSNDSDNLYTVPSEPTVNPWSGTGGSNTNEGGAPAAPQQAAAAPAPAAPQQAAAAPPMMSGGAPGFPMMSAGMPGGFTDVSPNAWYAPFVTEAVRLGLFQGMSPGIFAPHLDTTRAMFVQVLANFHGIDDFQPNSFYFDDVAQSTWYFLPIEWAMSNNVVAGMGDGTFRPSNTITREQMATMLFNFANVFEIEIEIEVNEAEVFADQDQISYWAYDAVAFMRAAGIIQGRPGGIFDPRATATRAEIATMLVNFVNAIEQ